MIRLALLVVAVALVDAARRSSQHDRELNGRAGRSGADRLAMLAAVGRRCGRLAAMLPAPPIRRDNLRERAGMAGTLDDRSVGEARLGATLLMGLVGLAGWLMIGSFLGVVAASGCVAFGWLYPDLWLRAAAARRADQIERQAPVALDLIAATVAAGVSLDHSLAAAAQAGAGPLRLELERVTANLALGRRRGDELRDLAERTGSPSLTRLATALRVSDRLGVPLADGLRRQARRARAEQSLRVQERAATAAPRMLLVVVLVLVPASLLPVLAALALTALGSAGGLGL